MKELGVTVNIQYVGSVVSALTTMDGFTAAGSLMNAS